MQQVASVAGMRCIEAGTFVDTGSGPNFSHDIARFLLDTNGFRCAKDAS